MNTNNTSIHYSRAGDIFHYRWAAKRCLNLLDFNTDLISITIEGSHHPGFSGEDVVDLAEYRENDKGEKSVEYFQLKHSTVRADKAFTISELEDSIAGFVQRFIEHQHTDAEYDNFKFTIITNRKISDNFKQNVLSIAKNEIELVDATFLKTVKKYTKIETTPKNTKKENKKYRHLSDSELQKFCSLLTLDDSEGNFNTQKHDIHRALKNTTVLSNISSTENNLIARIWQKVEPNQSNTISRQDMLDVFDILDIDEFFPAPPKFETLEKNIIHRQQQDEFIQHIINNTSSHTIITATGGVGKSIFINCFKEIFAELNNNHIVVAYDCFGNGGYRKTSETRHGIATVTTQVINELAQYGHCEKVAPINNQPDSQWIKHFLRKINVVCTQLAKRDDQALLVIAFDAVDNAVMASEELGGSCFAKQLLKEDVPSNCRLVFTCRPERINLLDAPSPIQPIELQGFSDTECLEYLQQHFETVSASNANEFNSLTNANPRLQSNALALHHTSIDELLLSFNAEPVTVDDLIEQQLNDTINRLKDKFPKNNQEEIDSICIGLATLPPYIPLETIAKIAKVDEAFVKSFVVDLGRPLLLIEDYVQFKDEPTETWFHNNYSANTQKVSEYVDIIKKLEVTPYLAESLPLLLLKAERFEELVELALSNDYLPNLTEYDDTLIKVARLQYAFKASLKRNKLPEACKLAFLAGQEISRNETQNTLLANNIDLMGQFLSKERISEFAHRRIFNGSWHGSRLVYSAALFSELTSYKGRASNQLRSAEHHLHQYFKKRDEDKNDDVHTDKKLVNIEILELIYTHLKLFGVKNAVNYMLRWRPPTCIYKTILMLSNRLIDKGEFDTVEQMVLLGKYNPSFVIAVTEALMGVGRTPPRKCLVMCSRYILNSKLSLDKPKDLDFKKESYTNHTYLSFCEACIIHKLARQSIRKIINHYYQPPTLYALADSHSYYAEEQYDFIRYIAIQAYLNNDIDNITIEAFIPHSPNADKDDYEDKRKYNEAVNNTENLLPLALLRIKALALDLDKFNTDINNSKDTMTSSHHGSYHDYNTISFTLTKLKFDSVLFSLNHEIIDVFYQTFPQLKTRFHDYFYFLRASCRTQALENLSESIENELLKKLSKPDLEEDHETYAENYINLARAVLTVSQEDSRAYFDKALANFANIGQDSFYRWNAVTAIAQRSADDGVDNPQLAYRYIRCAEMMGDSVVREKHWDRNEAIATCYKISPLSAFATVNRWKERNVTRHYNQTATVANCALDAKHIPPAILWSLSAFSWDYDYHGFFKKIIHQETDLTNKQHIIDMYVRDRRINGYTGEWWQDVADIAQQYNLTNSELQNVNLLTKSAKSENHSNNMAMNSVSSSTTIKNIPTDDEKYQQWLKTYSSFDILTDDGFHKAYEIFDNNRQAYYDYFWQGCFKQISARQAVTFLKLIVYSEKLSFYTIRHAFEEIPQSWKDRLAVQEIWPQLITHLASRFPVNLTKDFQYSSTERFLACFELNIHNNKTNEAIRKGVIQGLESSNNFESAELLFQFVDYISRELTVEEAKELINFTLSCLEQFIEDDYADGHWKDDYQLPKNYNQGLIYFIYANLGSPFAEERWYAIHAVIRLYRLGCYKEIEQLIDCLDKSILPIYLPPNFEFYTLNAQQHLLVALTRCVHYKAQPLVQFKDRLATLAEKLNQSIIITYYAKQICLEIERQQPNSFNPDEITKLTQLCTSQFQSIDEKPYSYTTDSPWHADGKMDNLPEFHFPFDFEQYWYQPLGRVFGISARQVQDIAKDVLFNEWNIQCSGERLGDAREDIWSELSHNRHYGDYEMQGRHGDHPDVDTYDFYVTYQLMMVVAQKLLENMPVVQESYHEKCSFLEWLDRHLLLKDNSQLLAENRDYIPVSRREWRQASDSDEWLWNITANDFIDVLIHHDHSEIWLNVDGNIAECEYDRTENISFSSVLVPKKYSQSLLLTTESFHDEYDYYCYLGRFCSDRYNRDIENNITENSNDIIAYQWLEDIDYEYDLERKDPFASDISAHPSKLCKSLEKQIAIDYSKNYKEWRIDNKPCFKNIYWSADKAYERDKETSSARHSLAKLEFLQEICKKMNMEIAIQVNIRRGYTGSYRRKINNDRDLPYSKTFILSADGRLRDTRKSYQLR